MENKQELWNQVKNYYHDKFGVEPALVDLMADYDILRLCASGSGNNRISEFLSMDLCDVEFILDRYLGFKGWTNNLIFSPLKVYSELKDKTYENFVDTIVKTKDDDFAWNLNGELDHAYNSAIIVYNLERLIDEKWI